MKKVWAILLVLLALLLTGCSGRTTVEADGVTYTLDQKENCLSDGENTYGFEITTEGDDKSITVLYPNGVKVRRTYLGDHGWSDECLTANNDIKGYASFHTLVTLIDENGGRKVNIPMILAGVVLAGAGAACVAKPESVWRITEGWRYESAEPGEFLLKVYTTVGMICVIGGVAMILGGILGAT